MPTPNPTPASDLSEAKSIILAAHYASSAELRIVRTLFSLHPSTFSKETQLRVLLCLPETTKPDLYVPLVKDSKSGGTVLEKAVNTSAVSKISERIASKRVKELLPTFTLLESGGGSDAEDMLLSYLVCRARNIDRETGALSIVIELLAPFIGLVTGIDRYLRGVVGVLARLTYDYADEDCVEDSENESGRLEVFEELKTQVGVKMLLNRCRNRQTVVGDLGKLVEPYLHAKNNDREGWEVVWGWLRAKVIDGNWGDFVEVVTKWDGPAGDQGLEEQFTRLSIAGCYMCRETEQSAWEGMRAIHRRCSKYVSETQGSRDQKTPDQFDRENLLTAPTETSLQLLDALITSAGVLSIPLANAAKIKLEGSHDDQKTLLVRHVRNGLNWARRSDDEWRRMRDGVRWLQIKARVLGKLTVEEVEEILLGAMLAAAKFALVKEIYVNGRGGNLGKNDVEMGILDAFQEFYDNASNGNKTRGSMKNALDALQILYPHTSKSTALERAYRLTSATHALSFYSLTLTPGIPLLPVQVRIHADPVSLIARVLDSNPKSFVQTETLVTIARDLCFGASGSDGGKKTDARVLGMCVEAALSENDFETAYSLAMNRLVVMVAENEKNIDGQVPDLIWRACFQAGRYRSPYAAPIDETVAFGGKALRTVEMRMELLAQALRFCPPSALAEVLASWRRCEEEMLAGLKEEEEEEQKQQAYWNNNTENTNTTTTTTTASRRRDDETPMGLFAVAAGAAKALRGTAFPLYVGRAGGAADEIGTDAIMAEEQRTRKRDMVSGMVTSGLASGLGWMLGAQPNVNRG